MHVLHFYDLRWLNGYQCMGNSLRKRANQITNPKSLENGKNQEKIRKFISFKTHFSLELKNCVLNKSNKLAIIVASKISNYCFSKKES